LKRLGNGEARRLKAVRTDAPGQYLVSVAESIRWSQHTHWCRHGDGPEWEREFFDPPILPFRWQPPGPNGFLGNWCEVFTLYRNEVEHRLTNMRQPHAAASSRFFRELDRLRGLSSDDVLKGLGRGSGFEYLVWRSKGPSGEFLDGAKLGVVLPEVAKVFSEFGAFAQSVRSALDTLVRIVSPAYSQPVPVSISRFSKGRQFTDELAAELKAAWKGWGYCLAEYRDCVVHYTPLSLTPAIEGRKVEGEWRVGCLLPDNPSARNVKKFRFAKGIDILAYSEGVLVKLDRLSCRLAELLLRLWRRGLYPVRPGPYFA
jgi:hypothetical protein